MWRSLTRTTDLSPNFAFSTCSEQSLRDFQNFIQPLPQGSIVLIAVKAEVTRYLDIRSRWIIETLGSRYILHLGFRDSWAMIGRVGANPRSAHEQIRRQFQGPAIVHVPSFSLKSTQSDSEHVDISLLSAGFEAGNTAGMLVDGRSILDSSIAGAPTRFARGIHVVVLNSSTGLPTQFISFDVHVSKVHNKQLQDFLQSVPYGAIVAITIKDEGSRLLNRFSRWLLEGLGSAYASLLSNRDSWCLVGTVGASPRSAQESYNTRKANAAILHARMKLGALVFSTSSIHIRLFSAGYTSGNMAGIQVNGKSVFESGLAGIPTRPTRGLNVAVVNRRRGDFLDFRIFDVFASQQNTVELKDFLRGLGKGQIVLITVMDEGSRFLDNEARRLCRRLGSKLVSEIGFRDSWSMIGSVGASAGSATEVLRKKGSIPAEVEEENFPLRG